MVRGGAKGATTAADVTSTAEGADHQAVDVQVYHGGSAINPTAIRALTASDVVTSNQGTAAALSGYWPVRVTDGTNTMPTGDVVGRALFEKITDGTNTAAVKAASTAAVATDPALVVAVSPNNIISTAAVDPLGVPVWGTAFDETRVAAPWTLADLINKYEIDPRNYASQTATAGTVTHVAAQSAVRLTVTGTSGSSAKLRTNTFYRYQAGKGLRWRTTLYHADTGQTNQTRRWGFFDDNDGLFFRLSGTTLSVVQRSSVSGSVVDTVVNQSAWNYDPMNGTGPSGITLDITKGNIYEGVFQWLGVGSAHFFINGRLVHTFQNANTIAAPYMRTAQLPMSWEVVNTGTSTASSLTYVCASVFVEGGDLPQATSFAAYNTADISVTTTERPVLSIRPKATYNAITNRMLVLPFLMSISTEGSRAGFRIAMNSTLTGASWTSVDANSGVEYDLSATSGTGGQTLFRGFMPNSNDSATLSLTEFFSDKAHGRALRLDAFATTQDVLTIYAINEAAGTTLMRASLAWDEVR
jgi:hypothetical protein